ncbi:MAG: hypothetical protein ACI8PZ_005059 [Myxococcota bacterium]|jgi:hypothetical protein
MTTAPASLTLQLTATCPSCHQPIHVPGLAETALCPACQYPLPLPMERWMAVFSSVDILEALDAAAGALQSATMFGALNWRYAIGNLPPTCTSCHATPPVEALPEAARAG